MQKNKFLIPLIILICFGFCGLVGTFIFSLYAGMTFKDISFSNFNISSFIFPMIIGIPIFGLFIFASIVTLVFIFGKDVYKNIINTMKK